MKVLVEWTTECKENSKKLLEKFVQRAKKQQKFTWEIWCDDQMKETRVERYLKSKEVDSLVW